MIEQPTRRGLLLGLGASLIAAPAIVRAASLMPVRAVVLPFGDPPMAVVDMLRAMQAMQNELMQAQLCAFVRFDQVQAARVFFDEGIRVVPVEIMRPC